MIYSPKRGTSIIQNLSTKEWYEIWWSCPVEHRTPFRPEKDSHQADLRCACKRKVVPLYVPIQQPTQEEIGGSK